MVGTGPHYYGPVLPSTWIKNIARLSKRFLRYRFNIPDNRPYPLDGLNTYLTTIALRNKETKSIVVIYDLVIIIIEVRILQVVGKNTKFLVFLTQLRGISGCRG